MLEDSLEATIKQLRNAIKRAKSNLGTNETYNKELEVFIKTHEGMIRECRAGLNFMKRLEIPERIYDST